MALVPALPGLAPVAVLVLLAAVSLSLYLRVFWLDTSRKDLFLENIAFEPFA
jgi:hypothetical protein